jgi:hypothetical protein
MNVGEAEVAAGLDPPGLAQHRFPLLGACCLFFFPAGRADAAEGTFRRLSGRLGG